MACFHPLDAFQSKHKKENGKRHIAFRLSNPYYAQNFEAIKLPCGQCIGCRLARSRDWAIRCMHEARMHNRNCFITLTYNDDNLPESGSLQLRDFQLFMKRLRKQYGAGIRFFHCGEYGPKFMRPHYHALLFNHDFEDRILFSRNNGVPLYTSESLSKLWCSPETKKPIGFTTIGDVTFDSAAYCARYITKKVNGELADDHYTISEPETGEIYAELKPEYVTMSRRPGIGRTWYDQFYKTDVLPTDSVKHEGREFAPPRFYDSLYELENPDDLARVKTERKEKALEHADNNTPERLLVRETVQKERFKRLPRTYEEGNT